MTAINFYILSAQKKLIPFVCQLSQTVLQKSDKGLLIITPTALLKPLDDWLWSFSDTAFIPHTVVTEVAALQKLQATQPVHVGLSDQRKFAQGFAGVVMNLTTEPLSEFVAANRDSKLLEIIAADELSLVHGREKYRYYRENFADHPLQTFQIA